MVGNIHHIRQFFRLYQVGDIHEALINSCANHGIGDLCNYQLVLICLPLSQLYLHPSPELNFSSSSLVDSRQILLVGDDASCGKIRPMKIFQKRSRIHLLIINVSLNRVNYLS